MESELRGQLILSVQNRRRRFYSDMINTVTKAAKNRVVSLMVWPKRGGDTDVTKIQRRSAEDQPCPTMA